MSKCRVIGAGAGIGRANGGGGYNTGGNQGGGDALEGLVSTTNMRVALVPYVRTRADGGNARNWVFCMNQLGGVGRRWGQAAGPGNRGGVHASCKDQAMRSRQRYPMRPKQSSGYGSSKVHRANAVLPKLGAAPLVSEEVTLPNFGGYYGVPVFLPDGTISPGPLTISPNPVQINQINSVYNVLVLGCIGFQPSTSGPNSIPPTLSNVVLTLRVPAGDQVTSGFQMLTITVTNLAWAYSDGVTGTSPGGTDDPCNQPNNYTNCPQNWDVDPTPTISTSNRSAYNSFKDQLREWLQGQDQWGRKRRALFSIGQADPSQPVTLPEYNTRSVSDGGAGTVSFAAKSNPGELEHAPPTALYRAALNLAYLMKDLCPDSLEVADCMGLDVTTRSTEQVSALQNAWRLTDAFSFLNSSNYDTSPYLRCSPDGIAPNALETGAVRSLLGACDTLAYPTAWTDPESLADGQLAIAPDLWTGFDTGGSLPARWNQLSSDGICAAIWLARAATVNLNKELKYTSPVSVAATIVTALPTIEANSFPGWEGNNFSFKNLVTSFGGTASRWCSCGGDYNIACPGIFVMSLEWAHTPQQGGGGGGNADTLQPALQQILENLQTSSCHTGTSYQVSGNPAVEGTYIQASTGQKAPTTSFASHAYVLQGATDKTATPTLWSECDGPECTRPRWLLSYVDLTSGAPNITATPKNPVYFAFCTDVDTCKTIPQNLRSDTAGADLITVTKIT